LPNDYSALGESMGDNAIEGQEGTGSRS